MSILQPGDEHMHYSDNSHRWVAPYTVTQAVWEAGVKAHLDRHLTTMGGPVEAAAATPHRRRPVRVPRTRVAVPQKAAACRLDEVSTR